MDAVATEETLFRGHEALREAVEELLVVWTFRVIDDDIDSEDKDTRSTGVRENVALPRDALVDETLLLVLLNVGLVVSDDLLRLKLTLWDSVGDKLGVLLLLDW